jgi:hypothetical protein
MTKKAAWERVIYRGTAGSTAATLVTPNVIDIGMSADPERTEITARGNGTTVPKKGEMIVTLARTPGPFTMIYDPDDAHFAAIMTAAEAGTPLAFLIKKSLTGLTEFDGDNPSTDLDYIAFAVSQNADCIEYIELQLCREFHCLPSQLQAEPADNVLAVLAMMSAEAHVRKARHGRN